MTAKENGNDHGISPKFYQIFDDSFKNLSQLYNLIEIFKLIIDESYEGIIILDKQGYIRYTNRKHAEYLNIPQDVALNAHISEITHLHTTEIYMTILKTGKPVLRKVIQAHDREFICNFIPFVKNGEIIGCAAVILLDIKDVESITKRVKLLESQLKYYKDRLKSLSISKYTFNDCIARSQTMVDIQKQAYNAAANDANILITGESGTGKELFAHAIHNQSHRRFGPFVRVNCSAIPRDLLEAELFGYEPGSFTGALKSGKTGKFEQAQKGSIFLDEIGDMPLQMQSELLRVLQEKEIQRIGSSCSIKLDFKLIAATNKNLEDMVGAGTFRQDLYYRLNVIRIEIPPLRNRKEDIEPLVRHFLNTKTKELCIKELIISRSAMNILEEYDYPGNVRELMNILERVIASMDLERFNNDRLTINDTDLSAIINLMPLNGKSSLRSHKLKMLKDVHEIHALKEAIKLSGGNLSKCASIVGIHRTGVHRKIKTHNLHDFVLKTRKEKLENIIEERK